MIEINLLPEERRKKQERFKRIDFTGLKLEKTAILGIIGAVFGVLLITQITIVIVGIFVSGGAKSLEKQYEAIASQKKEADALRVQINTVNSKVRAIDELMVNRFSWAKKLDDLNDSMIPGVWLSELSYDEKQETKVLVQKADGSGKTAGRKSVSRYLTLAGYALNTSGEGNATIGKFIKSMKNNEAFYGDFSDIQLGYTKLAKIEGQDVVVFRMICLFKEKTK